MCPKRKCRLWGRGCPRVQFFRDGLIGDEVEPPYRGTRQNASGVHPEIIVEA